MFKHRLRLPSPALVISLIALSLALGGTAIAASTTPHADAKADTKLIRKLAPTLDVKSSASLDSITIVRESTTIAAGDTFWATAKCPAKMFPISGGVYNTSVDAVVSSSDPWSSTTAVNPGGKPNEWFGASHNNGGGDETETVWAICEKVRHIGGAF